MLLDSVPIGPRVPIFDLNIAPFDPTRVTHAQAKCSQTRFRFGIIFGNPKQYANAAHPLRLLCVQCERPCCDRTANKHDELAPPHSMTSSAVARSDGATVMPSACAVFRLIANSNLSGFWTGMSAGLMPFSMRST